MAQMRAMAVMAIKVFNMMIAVLILWPTVPRLEALSDDYTSHDKNKQAQDKCDQHGGLSGQYQGYDEALYGDYGDYAHDSKHDDI